MHTTTITEADTGQLPASLVAPGHITWSGVVLYAAEFSEDDGTAKVRLEFVDNVEEHDADALVLILGTVALPLLHLVQDIAR